MELKEDTLIPSPTFETAVEAVVLKGEEDTEDTEEDILENKLPMLLIDIWQTFDNALKIIYDLISFSNESRGMSG